MTSIINSTVPEFKVQAYHNGKFVTVTNEDLKGKWAIFFFYPADFTFVCPTELVDMVDKYDRFKAMGVEIYSVSTDTHFVHKAWHDTSESIRKINYPMLADPTGVLSRGFGVILFSLQTVLRFLPLISRMVSLAFLVQAQLQYCLRYHLYTDTLVKTLRLKGQGFLTALSFLCTD